MRSVPDSSRLARPEQQPARDAKILSALFSKSRRLNHESIHTD